MVVASKALKNRSIYVYLPTLQQANQWKALAEKARIPISKFVLEHVENSLKQEEDRKNFESRASLQKRIREKDEEIAKLQQDNRLLKMLADNLDKELKKYRAKPFEDDGTFTGIREFDKDLIELIRRTGSIDSDRILKELGISARDTHAVKAVNKQLQSLQGYRLIEPTARGWKWTS